jgi:hypothetical protein
VADLPIPGLSRAILIGASTFTGLPALPSVRNNLLDLQAALTNEDTGILPADGCTILNDPRSTGAFMTQLRSAAKLAEDFLLVYYAGHGVRHEFHADQLYLAVEETDSRGLDGTAVPYASLRDVMQQTMARRKVLILDCCYSGLAVGAMAGEVVHRQELAVRGTAVLTSCPRNRESLSPLGDRHTAFTGELINLLNRGSHIPGEPLTVQSAYRSLSATLVARQLPEPMFQSTVTGSEILLRKSPPPPPPPVPIPPPVPRQPQDAPTIPAPHPVPSPALSPVGSASLVALFGWLLLQVGVAIGLALVIGGFGAATFAGEKIGPGVTGAAIAVACAIPVGARIVQLRKHGSGVPRLGERSPFIATVRRPMLITGIVIFGLIAMVGALAPSGSGPDAISVTTNTTMTTLLRKGTSPVVGDVPSAS